MAFNVGAIVATLGFQVDDDGAQKFERRLRTVRQDVDKPITAELRGDLNPRDLDLYERKLGEIRRQVAKRDQFKAALGANYDPRAFRAYERDLRKVERETDRNVRAQGRLRTAFGQVSGAGVGMFAAAGGGYAIYQGLTSIVTAAGDAESSMAKVRVMVENAGIDFDKHSDRIERTIAAHSRLSGFDDEDLAESFGNMIRTTGDLNEAFRLNAIAADVARSKGTELAGAQSLVARVANGSYTGLKRLGLAIEPVTKAQDALKKSSEEYTDEQLEAAKKTDDLATKRKALALLERTFAGQAKAYGNTQTGALERVEVAWENLRETIGEKVAPFITDAANRLADFITEMSEGRGEGGRFVDRLEEIWKSAKRVGNQIKDVGAFLKDHIELIKLAATAWVGYKGAAILAGAAGKAAAAAAAAGAAGGAAGGGGKGAKGAAARVAGGAGGAAASILAVKVATDFLTDKSDLGLLDQYADKIDRVAKTGDSRGMRELAKQLRDTAQANSDITKGKHLEMFAKALDDTARRGGKDLTSLQDAFARMAKSSGGSLESLREEFASLKKGADFNFGAVRDETRETRDAFRRMRTSTADDLDQIRATVRGRSRDIRDDLGKNSSEGRAALADNFQRARRAVVRQMGGAEDVTKKGMRAIRGFLAQELKLYGFTIGQARQYMRGRGADGQRNYQGTGDDGQMQTYGQRGMKFMSGGWLGAKGLVGTDTIEVAPGYWAAPGEYYAKGPGGHGAVINRHQAPLVNMALMRGGHTLDTLPRDDTALPRIEAALRDFGGLNAVFSAVRRPHMLQTGGIVSVPGFPGERANRSILDEIAWVTRRFGLTLTDAFGPGHKSPGHTVTGTAADFAGTDAAMDRAVAALVRAGYLVGYDGRFGSQAWPGHGPSTVAGGNAHLHVEFGTRGGSPLTMTTVPAFQIRGGGMLGAVAQGALNAARSGAQRMLDASSAALLSMPVGGGGTGGIQRHIANVWRQVNPGVGDPHLMSAIAMAESSGNERAHGAPDGRGWYQIEWPVWGKLLGRFGNPYVGRANTRMAREVLKRQGLGAWVVHNTGAFRQFMQRGGQFASGTGRAPGKGRARRSPPPKRQPVTRLGSYMAHLVAFADLFEKNLALAEINNIDGDPSTLQDDLLWLRRLENIYAEIVAKGSLSTAAEYAPQLVSTRAAISEIVNPPQTQEQEIATRPPTEEEIAAGVAAQMVAYSAARRSLFTSYGSNYTLAGQPLVPNTGAGLMHFGAATGGAQAPAAARVIHQTNIFPTPPPEPHHFARMTLHDLQAAP